MLTDAGFQAWFVGGCVRNAVIGAPASDLDLTTDATPDAVTALARAAGLRVVPTGVDHGTVTVIADGTPFEVTTFRRDVATDGRHATVAFAATADEDALRRDFTMNAIYAAPDGRIHDPLGGVDDARAGRVRFIGDADQRITEDYLRILRFFRFTAWYGNPDLGIDAEGLAACAAHLDGLDSLPAERIWQEVAKLLTAPDPAPAVAAMAACGALLRVVPGAVPDGLAVLVHGEQHLNLAPDAIRRLAVLGGDPVRLRLSNAQAARLALIRPDDVSADMSAEERAYRHGAEIAVDHEAVLAASLGQVADPAIAGRAQAAAAQVLPVRAVDYMPRLTGPAIGAALRQAEADWIASGFTRSRDDLLG